MRASSIEFRLRMLIQIVIVFLGFWAPWIGGLDLGRRVSTLEWLPLEISRLGIVSFTVASPVVIVAGALAAARGRRVARVGRGLPRIRCCAPPADASRRGDGRRTLSLCAESPLSRRMVHDGRRFASHAAHRRVVHHDPHHDLLPAPRFWRRSIPRFATWPGYANICAPFHASYRACTHTLPRAAAHPNWLIALLTEINPIGIFVTLAFLSWTYNNLLMIKAVLISFGISLVVRAFMPRGRGQSQRRLITPFARAKTAEVRESEAVCILQSVAQQAIDADVIHPDERHRHQHLRVQQAMPRAPSPWALCRCERRCKFAQPGRAVAKIAEHREVRHEPHRREKPPARTGTRVEHGGNGRHRQAFNPQQPLHWGTARRRHRHWFGEG